MSQVGCASYDYAPPQSITGPNRFEQLVKAELALTAWRYGKKHGLPGMSMIAQCIANRFKSGWGSFLQVIESLPKYSGTVEQPKTEYPAPWDRDFLSLLVAMDGIVDGTAKDTTNESLYFADTTTIDREWFLTNVSRNPERRRVADCQGVLTFWR